MNEQELQQAFIQFLAQKTGAKTQQELEQVIQQLGEDGLKQAYSEFMQLVQQQQVRAAKFGTKLNYIKQLRGQCPDGYDIEYYKSGGNFCKKCVKKQIETGDVLTDFKNRKIESDKCRKKIKKKKCQNGGFVSFNQNGNVLERFQKGKPVRKPIKKQEEPEMFEIETSEEVAPAQQPVIFAPLPRQPEAPQPIVFPEIDENNEALQAKLQELNKSFERDSTKFARRFTEPNSMYRPEDDETIYRLSRYHFGREDPSDENVINEGNYDEIAKGNYAPENFRQIRYYIHDKNGNTVSYGKNGKQYPYTGIEAYTSDYRPRVYNAPVKYVLPIKKRGY